MKPLPNPSIDTGMGLERIGALLQGKHDNYDTDLMRALIEASAHATSSDPDGPGKVHHRVIADHLRSTSFLIADGVMPSNEGRGYVLRRIMRRAMRHAHMLGAQDPVMHKLVPALVRQMGAAYPELARGQAMIEETLKGEETRFRQTLDRGLRLLGDELARLPEGADLPGETAFKLYDTYGFPLDLTQDALREQGRAVEVAGFDAAMAEQKAKARAAWSGSGEAKDAAIWFELADRFGATEFLGYDTEEAEGQILALVEGGTETETAGEGAQVAIVVNQSPFYAESGGQVGDTGLIKTDTGAARVTDTRKSGSLVIHQAEVTQGQITRGQGAALSVDHDRRGAIRANHSATHLLNEALREALGDHVAQKGSLNADDRLRFDFSHGKALTTDELARIEAEVNAIIRQNTPVETRLMAPDDAREMGAQALFGEKYGDEVRVVSMGRREGSAKGANRDTYSIELCGGTHVSRTGDIGAFVLLGDSASSAGVRRIEALTGQAALAHLRDAERQLSDIAGLLKAQAGDVVARVKAMADDRKAMQNEIAQLKRQLAMGGAQGEAPVGGVEAGGLPHGPGRLRVPSRAQGGLGLSHEGAWRAESEAPFEVLPLLRSQGVAAALEDTLQEGLLLGGDALGVGGLAVGPPPVEGLGFGLGDDLPPGVDGAYPQVPVLEVGGGVVPPELDEHLSRCEDETGHEVRLEDAEPLPLRRRHRRIHDGAAVPEPGVGEQMGIAGDEPAGSPARPVGVHRGVEKGGEEHVVAVAEGDELSSRQLDRAVAGGRGARVLLPHVAEGRSVGPADRARRVGGAVVDDDDLHLGVGLGEQPRDRRTDGRLCLVRRNDDADQP